MSRISDEDTYGRYSMMLDWDAVDRIYVVTVPDLPGCRTHGATVEEAARKGRQAIESWIDAARAWGRPIPAPRAVPVALGLRAG